MALEPIEPPDGNAVAVYMHPPHFRAYQRWLHGLSLKVYALPGTGDRQYAVTTIDIRKDTP